MESRHALRFRVVAQMFFRSALKRLIRRGLWGTVMLNQRKRNSYSLIQHHSTKISVRRKTFIATRIRERASSSTDVAAIMTGPLGNE